MARRNSARLRERLGEGRPDDRALRRTVAPWFRFQRDSVPYLRPDGVTTPEERSLLYGRLSGRGLYRIRTELPEGKLNADGLEAALSGSGAGTPRCRQCLQAVAQRRSWGCTCLVVIARPHLNRPTSATAAALRPVLNCGNVSANSCATSTKRPAAAL